MSRFNAAVRPAAPLPATVSTSNATIDTGTISVSHTYALMNAKFRHLNADFRPFAVEEPGLRNGFSYH